MSVELHTSSERKFSTMLKPIHFFLGVLVFIVSIGYSVISQKGDSHVIMNYLTPHGPIAMSGILQRQAHDVMNAYQPRVQFQPPRYEDEWTLVSGQCSGILTKY